MKRSLLVRAGEALAPDAFSLVLDSENDAKGKLDFKSGLTKKYVIEYCNLCFNGLRNMVHGKSINFFLVVVPFEYCVFALLSW